MKVELEGQAAGKPLDEGYQFLTLHQGVLWLAAPLPIHPVYTELLSTYCVPGPRRAQSMQRWMTCDSHRLSLEQFTTSWRCQLGRQASGPGSPAASWSGLVGRDRLPSGSPWPLGVRENTRSSTGFSNKEHVSLGPRDCAWGWGAGRQRRVETLHTFL